MSQNIFLYTLPQWFVLVSFILIGYGWAEKKKHFRLVGMFVLIALGVYAVWAIGHGYFSREGIESELIEPSFEGMLFPAYWSFVISGVLAFPALFLDWKNKRPSWFFMVLAALAALLGFLVIVGVLKSL